MAGKTGKGKGDGKTLGAVQAAFGAGDKGYSKICDAMATSDEFKTEFGDFYGSLTDMEQKLLSIQTLLPVAKKKAKSEAEAWTQTRKGILEGYRGKAAGKGIPWKANSEKLQSRGLDVWEKERAEITNENLVYPAYWEVGGKGTLHSYDQGNCCWEAAFDAALGAYELVHAHHFPEVPAEECFFKLHRELDNATIEALEGRTPKLAVDVGCGTGTSTFSLRDTLNSKGFEACEIKALDLSTYFVTVANHRLKDGDKKGTPGALSFLHGNALATGFDDGSVDIFMASAITHELPLQSSEHLFLEAARVLREGGVFGYFDLNPVQLLRDNAVENLVDRTACSNEPFLDEFLGLDVEATAKKSGLEVVVIQATNKAKWAEWQDCPCRVVIMRKLSSA